MHEVGQCREQLPGSIIKDLDSRFRGNDGELLTQSAKFKSSSANLPSQSLFEILASKGGFALGDLFWRAFRNYLPALRSTFRT